MAHRISVFALLATATCICAFAQPSELFEPSRALSTIDLSGTWEDNSRSRVIRIGLDQQGADLIGTDDTTDSVSYGRQIFATRYSGRSTFTGNLSLTNPPRRFTLTVGDPDTLYASTGHTFHRVSAPKLHDIPCDSRNAFHVTAKGASARADVTADAKDYPTSFCWLSMAASLGDKMAQYYTGLYLYGGIGTDKDYQRAFYWISKSAQQGYLDAQETLSALYRKGIGTSADPERADYWHDVWQRQLREQQAESQRPGIDSIQDALDTVFGGDSYPGQKCGWSYQAYIHFRPKDPCAGRPSK